ncbi:MAG: transposase [Collinsella sp.]
MLPPSAWTSTRDRSPPRRSTPSPARWCTAISGRTPPRSRSGPSGSRNPGPATKAAPRGSAWRASFAPSGSTAPWPPSPRCRGRRRRAPQERPARRRVHRPHARHPQHRGGPAARCGRRGRPGPRPRPRRRHGGVPPRQQRLNMFLIRLGHVWDERNSDGTRKGSWTRAHWRWISGIRLEGPQRDVLEYYVTAARCAESDRRQLEKKVLALARTDRWRPAVEALSCIKGIDTLTAFRLAAEAGSFTRFRTAPAFASWCGLVPSERSSGETERRGGITKTGNRLARTALVESAWHYLTCTPRPKPRRPARTSPRRSGARRRLHRQALPPPRGAGGGRQELVQGKRRRARELACWVWEIGCRAEGTSADPSDNKPPPGGPRLDASPARFTSLWAAQGPRP